MTMRILVLFAVPLFVALVGLFATGAARWTSCLAPGVEFCAEGRR